MHLFQRGGTKNESIDTMASKNSNITTLLDAVAKCVAASRIVHPANSGRT